MNKVFLIGNLTKDVELRESKSGILIGKFTIAVNERVGNEKKAHFIDVLTFKNTAEMCNKYLKKGRKVCISGSLDTYEYENRDGHKVKGFQIIANEVEFLSPVSDEENRPSQDEESDEDLPF